MTLNRETHSSNYPSIHPSFIQLEIMKVSQLRVFLKIGTWQNNLMLNKEKKKNPDI